jgi:hypothetical protein
LGGSTSRITSKASRARRSGGTSGSNAAASVATRLEASRLLADRGWGKAPTYAAIEEEDPLDLASLEEAAEDFRRRIIRLAETGEE